MPSTVEAPEKTVAPSHGDGNDSPRYRHLLRMSEQPYDMTVVTLCGRKGTGKPTTGDREKCPECLEVAGFISELDRGL